MIDEAHIALDDYVFGRVYIHEISACGRVQRRCYYTLRAVEPFSRQTE